MSAEDRPPAAADIAQLQQSLAAITAQLAQVTEQVRRLESAAASPPAPTMTVPSAPVPSAPQEWPTPAGAVVPVAVLPGSDGPSPAAPVGSVSAAWPSLSAQAAPEPSRVAPVTASDERSSPGWADTFGLKILGWVGSGVTLLGVILLLVVAIQQGLLDPVARVAIGAVFGGLLIGGGLLLRRAEKQPAIAATLVCTGLATEFLATVGAVHLAEIISPTMGIVLTLLIVAVAVAIATWWDFPFLAASALAVSAVVGPMVMDDLGIGVFLFEAAILLGGAACLFTRLGLAPWITTGIATGFVVIIAMLMEALTGPALLVIIVMVFVTWGTFIGRWVAQREPVDPGPFAIRPRSFDPAQIARDYADFDAHNEQARHARQYHNVAVTSLAVSGAGLALSLATVQRPAMADPVIGWTAVAFAILFAAVYWSVAYMPQLNRMALRTVAWLAAMACAAVALLRLVDGDARSVAWILLGIFVLVTVGVERMREFLGWAMIAACIALLAASPAILPEDLLRWPPANLLGADGLQPRAWTVVLPVGVCVLLLCAAATWTVSRCIVVGAPVARRSAGQPHAAGAAANGTAAPGTPATGSEPKDAVTLRDRTTAVGWTLVGGSVVACYGLLAITMVIAYAATPTQAGFQAGQIAVTVLFALVALVLLWQGFRRIVLRVGGLGIAAIAVAKLLLFDTRTLDALPRAITVIAVGALLLLAAVGYVMALARVSRHSVKVQRDGGQRHETRTS